MIDLHRHDEWSIFDGFGKASEAAEQAKKLGYTSLGISNHGTVNGLIQHYYACKENGIKPVMGIEAYFKPKVNEKRQAFHLCLFIKNFEGYKTLNHLLYEAEKQKYYVPIVTFENLEKYHKGLICSSACVASYASQLILKNKFDKAEKVLRKYKEIFEDDFYIEIQPYKIDDEGTQERVNEKLMEFAKKLKIKCILTSDSHYINKADFDTYKKMHEIAKHTFYDIIKTYKQRYMPTEEELVKRFIKMHGDEKLARNMIKNLEEIESKVDDEIIDKIQIKLPKFDKNEDSTKLLIRKIKEGLKKKGKYNEKYIKRVKEELEVIKFHKLEDYFLIVADYVNWAKEHGICVGPGRGSGCNSLINYSLGITEVDSLKFDLEFRRFLRKDKVKMPDIDIDFETARREEVIDYLLERYKGASAQICSYGLYKIDNLINDLAKTCGLDVLNKDKEISNEAKKIVKEIKSYINKFVVEGTLNLEELKASKKYNIYNIKYDNILKHFCLMYKKVRFIGTHAAGVALTDGNILNYCAVRINKKDGKVYTVYDLNDIEKIKVLKFDILGLKTMEVIGELRKEVDRKFTEDDINDKKLIENFYKGNTDGIFQFDKQGAKDILKLIKCDSFNDVIAASCMNRPGPLSVGVPEEYAHNKENIDEAKNKFYYKFAKESYGTLIYQEQIQRICIDLGDMDPNDADKIMKMERGGTDAAVRKFNENYDIYWKRFRHGTKKRGISKEDAFELFDRMFNYSFNKGHGTGYSLISIEEMYYKTYYKNKYWALKLSAESRDDKRANYKSCAIKEGCLILLPHVNGKAKDSLTTLDGEEVIQEGLSSIKGVGEKAANVIEEMGPFIDYPDFEEKYDELPKEKRRCITKRVIALLKEAGAFEFNEKKFLRRVVQYNTSLYGKNLIYTK